MTHCAKLMLDALLKAHAEKRETPYVIVIPEGPITVAIWDATDLILNITAFRQMVQDEAAADSIDAHGMVTR